MTTINATLVTAETPNKNNRLYPLFVCHEIAQAANRRGKCYGTMNRRIGTPQDPDNFTINMRHISHEISDFRVEGMELKGTVKILDTPSGRVLQEMHDSGIELAFRLFGKADLAPIGDITDPILVTKYLMVEVVAMPAELAA